MNDINPSIGLVKLAKHDDMNHRCSDISRDYMQALSGIKKIETPPIKSYRSKPVCHNYVVKLDDRDGLNEFLKKKGIPTDVHYIPNYHYEMYKKYKGEAPVSDTVWKRLLTIPLYPDLKLEEVNLIINSIVEFLN